MQSVDMFLEPARGFLNEFFIFTPHLLLAVLIVIAGWFAAKLVRYAVERGLRAINFGLLTGRSGMDEFLQQGGTRGDTTTLFGLLAFWFVVISVLVVVFNFLGLAYATDLLSRLVLFVPKLILALLILTVGAYFSQFVGGAVLVHCRDARVADADFLAKLAQYAVLTFVILIALDLTGLGGEIVRDTFLIILTGVVLAFALAFGLGGKCWAARMLDHWWPAVKKDGES